MEVPLERITAIYAGDTITKKKLYNHRIKTIRQGN